MPTKTTKSKKPKKPSVSALKKKADAIFSLYIRTKYADPHTGLVACVTCGTLHPIKEIQNGHYISRGNNWLRYDERNCHPQDYSCNIARKGNYPAYAAFIVRTYGVDRLEELHQESKALYQWKPHLLEEIISEYTEKLKKLSQLTSHNS